MEKLTEHDIESNIQHSARRLGDLMNARATVRAYGTTRGERYIDALVWDEQTRINNILGELPDEPTWVEKRYLDALKGA